MVNNHTVADNDTEQNTGPGIGVYDAAQSNTISNNASERNKDSGILLDSASNNSVQGNHVRSNGTPGHEATGGDGMRANAGATNNTIRSNFMKNNVDFDCHDGSTGAGTAGTANFWISDMGDTQNRPGLCQPSSSSDEQADRTQEMQVQLAAGWDPAYPWYTTTGDPVTTEFDWATAYATVDTQSLLQLLAQLQVVSTRPLANPSVD
jgi:parallel beta-helix repeat protein